jgi:hypothetical protein
MSIVLTYYSGVNHHLRHISNVQLFYLKKPSNVFLRRKALQSTFFACKFATLTILPTMNCDADHELTPKIILKIEKSCALQKATNFFCR